jgi:tetratricopeptide (TPR) repeat protein
MFQQQGFKMMNRMQNADRSDGGNCLKATSDVRVPQGAPLVQPGAQSLWLSALQLVETADGGNPLRLAQFLNHLAKIYEAHDDQAKAACLYERLAHVLEQVAPQPKMLHWHWQVWVRLAKLQQAQGQFPEAEQWLRRALTLVESSFGQRSQEAAYVQQRLATLLQAQQRLDEAYEYYERALDINENLFGEESGLVIELCRELGRLAALRGQRAEAEHFAYRAGNA